MQIPCKFSDYQLAIANSHYQLPITNYQLPITNYQLPITNYQFSNLRIATFVSVNCQPFDKLSASCQLSTANCQLSTVNCQLSTVNCLFYQSTSALSSTTR
ncbi:hypothetical protein [Microcoleus sp. PH2017_24_DOB_U_A]|uniref:hypothetical protein n=1 Tax=Microcoleus sp. PH2017_24_DOB_U_A TaxID=2798834 RepID=UPI001D30354A|nr:hypothetical protein [Microcoleus sp. PH2017_24_DOB_U_A]MCC3545755.1 hypothetical protein [Microcoleus sp. PH2017_24_DOB_U_A]